MTKPAVDARAGSGAVEEESFREEEEEEESVQEKVVETPKSPKKATIADRTIRCGRTISIVKNQYPRGTPRRYRMTSIPALLVDAVKVLGLTAKATKAFRKDGRVVTSIDDVEDQDTLYISCGEAFNYGMPSPVKRKLPVPAHDKPEPKTPEKTTSAAASGVNSPTSPRMNRRQREIQQFNRVVALAPRTTDENMKIATASVYASLEKSQKAKISALQSVHDDVQDGLFMHQMLRQQMIPMLPVVDDNLRDLAVEVFRGINIDEVKFVVGGPRQSGKSTMLYTLATVLLKKLRLSSENEKYLVFPINFELQSVETPWPHRLLRLFVNIAFESLECCFLKVVPYLEAIRSWFVLSVFGQLVAPPKLSNCSFIDIPALTALAKSLNVALNEDDDHSIESFLEKVCQFPRDFARAFGLKDVLFVIDAFEYSNQIFEPRPDQFSRALKPGYLCDYLCLEMSKSPYLVSLKDEQQFFECFSCDDAALLDTEGMITDPYADGYLRITQPSLKLAVTDCLGCPGYIARFQKIWDLVVASYDNAAYPHSYSMVRTLPEVSRQRVIKQEITKLVSLLYTAGNKDFTKDLLNEMGESETMTVKFVETEPLEEEDDEEAQAQEVPQEKAEEGEKEEGAEENEPSVAEEPAVAEGPAPKRGMTIKMK